MPIDNVQRIRTKSSTDLSTMLAELNAGNSIAGWSKGKAFEHIILRGFEIETSAESVEVTWPFEVRLRNVTMEQIDGAIYHDGIAYLVESKDYKDAINIEAIAKLRNQLWRRPHGTMGMVFARSGYTEPAKELTRMITPLQILLWEYEELVECIRERSLCRALRTKYKYAVEHGIPDYNIEGGMR